MKTEEQLPRRGLGWWLSAIFAPIGIVGGPIALANLFATAIHWNGPIAYAVSFWDQSVSQPFGVVLSFLAQIVHVHRPPKWAIDYMSLSILFAANFYRSLTLLNPDLFSEESKARTIGEGLAHWIGSAIVLSMITYVLLFMWPLLLLFYFYEFYRGVRYRFSAY